MKLSPKLRFGVIIVGFTIFFIVLNLTGFSKEVKNFFYFISKPVQKTLWRVGDRVSDFFEGISEMKNLKKENEELKFKIQKLLVENISLSELKKENEILREALKVGLEKEFKLTFSQLIGKDISQDSILIDKGFKDGIEVGFPVITQEKVLCGKVSEVFENFSRVMLISHKESNFSVKVSKTQGLLRGKGNLNLFLDLIPRDKEISPGDTVFTSALGGVFPEGLLVGEILEVKKSDIEMWQTAEIKPAFNLEEIEMLFIITEW